MNRQRLYENIMRDLRDAFSSMMNEDVLDDLDRIGSGKTSVEKILDMNSIFVRQGKNRVVELKLSADENKNEIMRLVGDRFHYFPCPDDNVIDIDEFLWKDSDGDYSMWIYGTDLMKQRWSKGRIFATAHCNDEAYSNRIQFTREDNGKWYAIYRTRDANGGRYRFMDIRQ